MISRAGLLDERVTFQVATEVQDAAGEPDQTWGDLATRWAAIGALTGREMVGTMQTQAEVDFEVRLRHDPTVATLTPKHRMRHDSRTFEIVYVLNQGKRGREVTLLVKEIM